MMTSCLALVYFVWEYISAGRALNDHVGKLHEQDMQGHAEILADARSATSDAFRGGLKHQDKNVMAYSR